jgi:shikimate kinase / 3-dehydroquinate synthase
MGAGKSEVAPLLGRRLGLPVHETDARVEAKAGRSIPEIFSELGEGRFRALEAEVFEEILREGPAIVATGGGTLCNEAAWGLVREAGALSLRLSAPADVLAARISDAGRPLLAGAGSEAERTARLSGLLAERERWYRRCDVEVDATFGPEAVTEVAAQAVADLQSRTVPVRLPGSAYVVWLDADLADLGPRMARRLPPEGAAARCALVADAQVAGLHGQATATSLRQAGYEVVEVTFPSGEEAKTLETAGRILDALLGAGLQRGAPIVALGGGVTGDLAGFVAAILHRGCPVVQVPTTLLAMVDSSVGGKTAVNHPTGKNLIGAFHQPALVFAPLETLGTLDDRSYRAGLGEVLKYGLLDARWALLETLEATHEALVARDPEVLGRIVARCVAIKAAVVEGDPGERTGLRRSLNLGHTLGHALEAEGGYARWLHGEAVGLGLLAAARIGASLGLAPPALEGRVRALLGAFGLPDDPSPLVQPEVVSRVVLDKKAEGSRVHFVVPVDGGGTQTVPLSPKEIESHLRYA